ncbi:Hsp20/alpha crystallin family protein [Streptomyces sp. NPDC002476]|uniref:Hsp20/alpha crystallin family protein n=1 Tax=Streptomyces sp. NPDC002476 TaxID=3364648 RepID=UPI0036C136F0
MNRDDPARTPPARPAPGTPAPGLELGRADRRRVRRPLRTDDALPASRQRHARRRGLCITGEYKQCEREGILRRSTRRTGRFEYWALLPADVKAEEITAELVDGVLTITAPKGQAARPHHIEITQA